MTVSGGGGSTIIEWEPPKEEFVSRSIEPQSTPSLEVVCIGGQHTCIG